MKFIIFIIKKIIIMYKNFSLTDKEKKEILEQHGSRGYKQPKEQISHKKPLNEQPFGDDSKFFISHVGIPVDIIMVSVELDGFDDGDVTFTLKVGRSGNLTIVDFTNDTKGEIDDEEVKEYMENMIANGELNVSDYISFDPNTGVYRNLQW